MKIKKSKYKISKNNSKGTKSIQIFEYNNFFSSFFFKFKSSESVQNSALSFKRERV